MSERDDMAETVAEGVPSDLVDLVKQHSRATIAGDTRQVLDDFRPDRLGQLVNSAKLPEDVISSQLLHIAPDANGLIAAVTCYTAADGTETVLRARWIKMAKGWVVNDVRNLPDTPPPMVDTGPAEDGRDTQYWEGLRDNELRIPRCGDCANWIWPPRPICARCHSFSYTWTSIPLTGTVFSWIRTWLPFAPEFSGHLPFTTVVVELPQADGRRLLGVLLDADGVDPKVGQGVVGEIEAATRPDGWPMLRWRLA